MVDGHPLMLAAVQCASLCKWQGLRSVCPVLLLSCCLLHMQIHSQIAQWSQDLFQLKSIMDTLEEEEQLDTYQPMLSSGTQAQTTDSQSGPNNLLSVTAELNEKTEAVLASSEGPKDGLSLLEDIATLSKQMVGEAQEDKELFKRASSKTIE